jgi:hypothetical protein
MSKRLNLTKNMHVFDQFADQFARLPMFFMTFHGQESIDKVINVRKKNSFFFKLNKKILDNGKCSCNS